MTDSRVLAAILLLGAAAIATKLIEVGSHVADLWRWHVDAEPIVIDTQTNGGVKTSAWSGTSQTR